jgi:hypothetical protein
MAQRFRSIDQRQIVAPGEKRKKPRLSRPHKGGMEYERVEALSPIIKEMVAAGVSHERIARLVINQNTGKPISVETLQKYYGRELEVGLAEANLAMSRSAFAQGIGSPGVPNPNYGKSLKGTKPVDKHKWLVDPIAPVPAMTIWWEKTRAGKTEGAVRVGTNSQPVQQPTIIVLPPNGRGRGETPILDLLTHE